MLYLNQTGLKSLLIRFSNAIVFSFLIASCTTSQPLTPPPTATTAQSAAEEVKTRPKDDNVIRIGVLATLEGTFQTLGEDGVRGVEMAVAEFGGEIAGKKIELIKESTNLDVDVAFAAAQKTADQVQVDREVRHRRPRAATRSNPGRPT